MVGSAVPTTVASMAATNIESIKPAIRRTTGGVHRTRSMIGPMVREIVVPGLEGAADVTLGAWLRQVGDQVVAGDAVAEALTDKVNAEIESPYSGVVEELLVDVGAAIQPGQPIARVRLSAKTP